MAINYATKYSPKVAERFKKGSITNAAAGHDYNFAGAKTVVVEVAAEEQTVFVIWHICYRSF